MRFGIVLCGVAAIAVTSAAASEGLMYAALYYCHAQEMNRTLVRSCSVKFPAQAGQAEKALAKWSSEYGAKAQAGARKCQANIEKESNAKKRAATRSSLGELKDKWFANIQARVESEGAVFCERAISQLGTNRGEFEDSIWSMDDGTARGERNAR